MKKILLTGGTGFIGKNILEQLRGKYNFIAPSHRELDLTNTEIVDKFFKRSGNFDLVIHTAIVGGTRKTADSPQIAVSNLRMFFNVAKNRKYFSKMIHLGSGIEYGKEQPLVKVEEEDFDKYVPQGNFGFYKYFCGKFVENSQGMVNLRLFGVFGKYEDATIKFISNAICKSILGMSITINQNVFFDYLYIEDFINILDYFITHKARYRSYNVGRGKPIDLITIAKKISKIANSKSPIKVMSKGLAYEYTCNNRRLLEELGNFEFADFDKSLRQLYSWYLAGKRTLRAKNFLGDNSS